MKSFTTAAMLGLAAMAAASPLSRAAKRQTGCIVQTVTNPSQTDVENSINQWNDDVVTVNNFLNNAGTLIGGNSSALVAAAQVALTSATDEPCQLMTLASQPDFADGPAAFTCAVQDLMNVFQTHVLDNLNTIIADPSDTSSVQAAVQDINNFRCCNVLGDASILWQDSAEDNGIADVVNVVAPFENACSSIGCTNACSQEDNGSFGTPGDGSSTIS